MFISLRSQLTLSPSSESEADTECNSPVTDVPLAEIDNLTHRAFSVGYLQEFKNIQHSNPQVLFSPYRFSCQNYP